jgi:hypothetical protein
MNGRVFSVLGGPGLALSVLVAGRNACPTLVLGGPQAAVPHLETPHLETEPPDFLQTSYNFMTPI